MNLEMTREVYEDIRREVGSRPAESGGILLGSRDDYKVRRFIFDLHGSCSSGGYDPDVAFINAVIKAAWEQDELALLGFVHSHPPGVTRLSGDFGNNTGDLGYLNAIFAAMPGLKHFLVPLAFTEPDTGAFSLIPYIAKRGEIENYYQAALVVDGEILVPAPQRQRRSWLRRTVLGRALPRRTPPTRPPVPETAGPMPAMDPKRLTGAVDVERMAHSHVVCIGVGGSNGLLEDLVRSGLGALTAMDFDTVDPSNLCTQGFTRSDIGQPKVEALGARLKTIHPEMRYTGLKQDFLTLSDEEVDALIGEANLLLMMTDDFHAQARGNKAALRNGIPALFAMVYEKARAAEATFVIPSVTPACHRCAVSDRYRAYLEEGYENDVESTGSTVFHTRYVNACLGLLALAILHRDRGDLELGGWFGKGWDRNLVQMRMSPHYGVDREGSLFHRLGAENPRIFAFDALWQRIEPEAPPKYDEACPDCGGTGMLGAGPRVTGADDAANPARDVEEGHPGSNASTQDEAAPA